MIEVTFLTPGSLHAVPVSSLMIAMQLAAECSIRSYVARVWIFPAVGNPILLRTVRRGGPVVSVNRPHFGATLSRIGEAEQALVTRTGTEIG